MIFCLFAGSFVVLKKTSPQVCSLPSSDVKVKCVKLWLWKKDTVMHACV